jgi:hypothetical protein
MSMISGKPWRFEAIGEGLADFLNVLDIYGIENKAVVRPVLIRFRVTTTSGGNVMLTTSALDPHILFNKTLAANADITVEMEARVKGFFIEDLPADGLVEVWFD